VREEILFCLSSAEKNLLLPTKSDLETEQREKILKENKIAQKNLPQKQRKIFFVLVLIAVILMLFLSSSGKNLFFFV
jgi:hypothetical protein